MSFKIIVEVPDSKVLSTLKLLDGHKCYVEQVGQAAAPVMSKLRKMERVGPHNRIMLGSKHDAVNEGTMNAEIVNIVKQHEKKFGPGDLTRKVLTMKMEKHSDAPGAAIGLAIKTDVIRGIADD